MRLCITLPWPPKELSPNARLHWAQLRKHTKAYREACYWQSIAQGIKPNVKYPAPVTVTLEFVPPARRHYDVDNLIARMKSGLDGLADALGVNDRDFRLGEPSIAQGVGGMVRVALTWPDKAESA